MPATRSQWSTRIEPEKLRTQERNGYSAAIGNGNDRFINLSASETVGYQLPKKLFWASTSLSTIDCSRTSRQHVRLWRHLLQRGAQNASPLLKALPDTIPEGDLHDFRYYVLDPIKMKDIGDLLSDKPIDGADHDSEHRGGQQKWWEGEE
ncbi:hypothetical protein B0H14DRAFT_3130141 [Mycena olivaceomarginata]|nr:hypothetical protein B0H14DRAFT_3130141 [Mycena olivaceomarginata]